MSVDTTENAEKCCCGGRGCLEASIAPRRILFRLQQDKTRAQEVENSNGDDCRISFQTML